MSPRLIHGPIRQRINESLILAGVGARRNSKRLTMCLQSKSRCAHIRYPNLDGTQPLPPQAVAMFPHFRRRALVSKQEP